MANFLAQTREDIDRRLKELRPLVDEYHTLERAKEALDGIDTPRRGPGRPRGSTRRPAPAKQRQTKQRRRRRGGTRREQVLKLVGEKPGITVNEMAEQLTIKPNYLYRVMAELKQDGSVKKKGRGFQAG